MPRRVVPWLVLAVSVLAGCAKAQPRATAQNPYEAQQIRTLTHDEDLARTGKGPDPATLRARLGAIATPSAKGALNPSKNGPMTH